MNRKYEITDISHPQHPWLHRIRAKEDIGESVKAGDLGGFVENESNLSFEPGDESWLFDDTICCGEAYVCKDACLRDSAIAKDRAYVSHSAMLCIASLAENDAIVRGALLGDFARVSGASMLIQSPQAGYQPAADKSAAIYGKVIGNFHLSGNTVVLPSEEYQNDRPDRFYVHDNMRTVQREPGRNELKPSLKREKTRGQDR